MSEMILRRSNEMNIDDPKLLQPKNMGCLKRMYVSYMNNK